ELTAHPLEDGAGRGERGGGEAGVGEEVVAPAEAEVAGEDRPGGAEAVRVAVPAPVVVGAGECAMHRRLAAAGLAVVHDVVVDERGGLEELHRRGEGDRAVVVLAPGGAPAPVGAAGPQPLAALEEAADRPDEVDDLGADLGELGLPAVELGVQTGLDPHAQVGPVQRVRHVCSSREGGGVAAVSSATGDQEPAYVAPA